MQEEDINYPQLSVYLTHVVSGLLTQADERWDARIHKPWLEMSHEERIAFVKSVVTSGTIPQKVDGRSLLEFVYRMALFEQKDPDGNPLVVMGKKQELQMVAYTIYRLVRSEDPESFSMLSLRAHVSALLPRKVEKREEISRLVTAFILDTALECLHP
jgi:hypothetical protein